MISQVISNSLQDGFTSSSIVHRMNTRPYFEDSCSGIFDYSTATYNYTVMWSLLPNDCPNRFIVPSYSVTLQHATGFGELDLQSTLVSSMLIGCFSMILPEQVRPPSDFAYTVSGLAPLGDEEYQFLVS